MALVAYTDGGARNNPGPAGIGVVIYENGNKLHELSEYIGEQTNNWAEYEGVIHALTHLIKESRHTEALEVRMDSKLVVEQLSGNWKIKEPALQEQAARAHELMRAFPHVTFTYVPREQNKEADALANKAMDEGQGR